MISLEKLGLIHFRELLRKARDKYLIQVASKAMAYGMFARVFIASNRVFEAATAEERMDYAGSLCLIEILLQERKDLAEAHLQTKNPTEEDENIVLLALLQERRQLQTDIRERQEDKAPPRKNVSLAFQGLTDGELKLIADCANNVGMFTRDVTFIDIKRLLNETLTESLTIKNRLLFAYLFDKLYGLSLIHHHWQKALAESPMPLLQGNGQHIKSSNLSTALSHCIPKPIDGKSEIDSYVSHIREKIATR